MRRPIQIGSLEVSTQTPPLIIAEIGINHGGSLKVAKEMVDSAKRAGATCIKHQTHIVDDEMSREAIKVIPGNATISIYEIMAKAALPEDDEYSLKCYVEAQGLVFLSTPFSRAAASRLREFDVDAYKIGSGECNNHPLVEHIASFGKPMILSTGMNSLQSVKKTVTILEKHKVDYALLHTTNLYPTPPALVRLGGMQALMEAFPDILIGLSDHTLNNNSCLAATALGASILERHFTDKYDRVGPDIVCSMDEEKLQTLIRDSAEIFVMLGGKKEAAPEEQVTIDFAFATVVATSQIKKGEVLSEKNVWVKRPGTGAIFAEDYKKVLGKRALVDIPEDTHIEPQMLEGWI